MRNAALVVFSLTLSFAAVALLHANAHEIQGSPRSNDVIVLGKFLQRVDAPEEQSLFAQLSIPLVDTSPERLMADVFVATHTGEKQFIASDVESAKVLSETELLFVSNNTLRRASNDGKSKKVLAIGVKVEFAISPNGQEITITRSEQDGDDDYTDLSTINLNGRVLRTLMRGPGPIGNLHYSPDGQYIIFVAAFDGLASWYRIHTNGSQFTQLTNRGQTDIDASYIPVPCRSDNLNFINNHILIYDSCDGFWQLDILNAEAKKLKN